MKAKLSLSQEEISVLRETLKWGIVSNSDALEVETEEETRRKAIKEIILTRLQARARPFQVQERCGQDNGEISHPDRAQVGRKRGCNELGGGGGYTFVFCPNTL